MSIPNKPSNGSAMDKTIAPSRRRKWRRPVLGLITLLLLAGSYALIPRGLRVELEQVQIATVSMGTFSDDLLVRATVEPSRSVLLDAVESGRVEEVFMQDGSQVSVNAPLFRLSNPQRHLDLLARQSDVAQQFANLANMRQELVRSQGEHQRRWSELSLKVQLEKKRLARDRKLAAEGLYAPAALEELQDNLARHRLDLRELQKNQREELSIRQAAIRQMEMAQAKLQRGIRVLEDGIDALTVRAPIAGQLTNFTLQVGASVKQGERVGRLDAPDAFKLTAELDEFYLPRVKSGLAAKLEVNGKHIPLMLNQVNPQVQNGRFKVELIFSGKQPAGLRAGQGGDCRIQLGTPGRALLLPNGAFITDSGGAWVYVLSQDGKEAQRRAIRLGRRSQTQLEVLNGLKPGERVIVSSYAPFGQYQTLTLTH